jgi:hypothetical protein
MYEASATFAVHGGPSTALKTLVDEVSETLAALLNPGKVIAEVEQMQALRTQATRLQSRNPAAAAQLRRRAARTGLR